MYSIISYKSLTSSPQRSSDRRGMTGRLFPRQHTKDMPAAPKQSLEDSIILSKKGVSTPGGQPRWRGRRHKIKQNNKKTLVNKTDKIQDRNIAMNCLPALNLCILQTMPWFKKSNDRDEEEAMDPLSAIVEEAKNATYTQPRTRLVRFDLKRNQLIDDTTATPEPPIPSSHNTPGRSILLASTSSPSSWKNIIISSSKIDLEKSPSTLLKDTSDKTLSTCTSNSVEVPLTEGSFVEDEKITCQIKEFIQKGKRYHKLYNYNRAAKNFLQALKKLEHQKYPQDHELRILVHKLISDTHHSHRNLQHSANIVKIGLSHESRGKLEKAYKMYIVAFRIRNNSLGFRHPSIPVLLNLLGGIQVRRGEYEEAMQLYELALYGKLKKDNNDVSIDLKRNVNFGVLALSMREIASIHEHFGRLEEAMSMYHDSIHCAMKDAAKAKTKVEVDTTPVCDHKDMPPSPCSTVLSEDSYDVCVVNTSSSSSVDSPEEMEVYLQENSVDRSLFDGRSPTHWAFFYDSFFQVTEMKSKKMNLHVATTLHRIASIHRKKKEFSLALSSYHASLRGMKHVHGGKHPNVAAVLGNIGNLLKEMKDYDRAFEVYQSVLKMESLHLGYAHPSVLVSMLNIAMIEQCRGRYDESISLYKEVTTIIGNRIKNDEELMDLLVVAHSCLGDVFEKSGDIESAIDAYKQGMYVQTLWLDQFHPDLGKSLHKLGLLCSENGQLRDADAYFAEALRLYKSSIVATGRVVGVEG